MDSFICRRDLLLAITLLSSFFFAQPVFTRSGGHALRMMTGTGTESTPTSRAKVEFRVDRTPKSLQNKEDAQKEEVLVFEGLVVPNSEFAEFVVFINLPEANETTPIYKAEYAGSFYSLGSMVHSRNIRLGISGNLKRLGIAELSQILISVVARGLSLIQPPLTVNSVFIQYD